MIPRQRARLCRRLWPHSGRADRDPGRTAPDSFETRIRKFLAPEIQAGKVQVFEDAQTVTVRLTNRNMFGSGEAVLSPNFLPLVARIGEALNEEPGKSTCLATRTTSRSVPRASRRTSNCRRRARTPSLKTACQDDRPVTAACPGKGTDQPDLAEHDTGRAARDRRTEIILVRAADAS